MSASRVWVYVRVCACACARELLLWQAVTYASRSHPCAAIRCPHSSHPPSSHQTPLLLPTRYVTLESGTERAFTGKTVNGYAHDNKQRGTYVSAVGGLPLFSSDTKFNSGTGWPSFYAPVDPEHIIEVTDTSIPFMPR